ncbi:hypothetical protein [Tunicatimonas pelagia]|uniref:hypothetical protein n=1 Tax=Tunicatimonas pelagia TaxID=931531 RepID=UPI003F53E8D0
MIALDVTFIMNGANHLSKAISTYPFAIFGEDWSGAMDGKEYPTKGNTTIGNDVWIGFGATIIYARRNYWRRGNYSHKSSCHQRRPTQSWGEIPQKKLGRDFKKKKFKSCSKSAGGIGPLRKSLPMFRI